MSTGELFDPTSDLDIDSLLAEQMAGDPRPLEERDRRLLTLHGAAQGNQHVVENMRASHHSLARLLAAGYDAVEVAEISGYSAQHIRLLAKNSGAFQELVSYYNERVTEHVVAHRDKLHAGAGYYLDSLVQDIIEREQELSPEFKLKAMEKLMNFSGYKPVERSERHVAVAQLTSADIAALKRTPNANSGTRDESAGQDPRPAGAERPALPSGGDASGEPRVGPSPEAKRAPTPSREPARNDGAPKARQSLREILRRTSGETVH